MSVAWISHGLVWHFWANYPTWDKRNKEAGRLFLVVVVVVVVLDIIILVMPFFGWNAPLME